MEERREGIGGRECGGKGLWSGGVGAKTDIIKKIAVLYIDTKDEVCGSNDMRYMAG